MYVCVGVIMTSYKHQILFNMKCLRTLFFYANVKLSINIHSHTDTQHIIYDLMSDVQNFTVTPGQTLKSHWNLLLEIVCFILLMSYGRAYNYPLCD